MLVKKPRDAGAALAGKIIRTRSFGTRCLAAAALCALTLQMPLQACFAMASTDAESTAPAGTLLIPLTPKLDTESISPEEPPQPKAKVKNKVNTQASVSSPDPTRDSKPSTANPEGTVPGWAVTPESEEKAPKKVEVEDDQTISVDKSVSKQIEDNSKLSAGEKAIAAADKGQASEDEDEAPPDTVLRGTVQITADDTEYDQGRNTFIGTGNAVALIAGQKAKLEADSIQYNQTSQMMDARGSVRILRDGELTTGASFKFNVSNGEYLITEPNTTVNGSIVVARKALGSNTGTAFRNGALTLADPVFLQRNAAFGTRSYLDDASDKQNHPDAYIPPHQSFVFKAKKMVYEKYKQDGNLTIFGGRIETGNFSIPVGKVVMTAGNDNPVTFPVTPFLGNNLQTGGFSIGPRFANVMPNNGVLTWAPLVQIGGQTVDALATKTRSVGLGGQIYYHKDNFQFHLGYGSTTNLFVSSIKYKIYKRVKFQAGVNRFLDDGMFGTRRAKYTVEAYDNHQIKDVPYFSLVNVRSSVGWFQDNPQLLNNSPTAYKQLFGSAANTTVENRALKIQEQLTATTHPLFAVGDRKYGVKSYIYGGVAARAYSTGDASVIGQLGPVLDLYLNRVRAQIGYTQGAVRGSSPFVFDQYIQGNQSGYIAGDYKFSKFLSVGGSYGLNISDNLAYQKQINIAVGPPDFKVLAMYNSIMGTGRLGFDVLYGSQIPFQQLILKGKADQGQLGGI